MRIGIILDDWKLPIFEQKLNDAGYKFTQAKGPTDGTIAIKVENADAFKLRTLVMEANRECTQWKNKRKN